MNFRSIGRKQINFIPILWGIMHKNTYATVTTLTAIAISAILLTSFTMVGTQLSQRALAQNATSAGPSTNATSPGPSTNATSPGPSAPSATPSTNATSAAPAVGQSFVWQGTASSQISPLGPKHSKEYVAAVLKPRDDGAVYSGVLTYTASKGANVEIWHDYNPGNTSALATKTFGAVKTAPYNGKTVAVVDLSPSGASGSVPFSGNAVLLHASSPFTVTYTVNAVAQPAKITNNVASSMAAAPTPAPKSLSTSNSTGKTSSSSKSSKSTTPPLPTSLS
jgi:hypothetical protein